MIPFYLDMDGVLCNWMDAALKLHGNPTVDHGGGFWGCAKSLGLTEDQFWEPIHAAGESFWADLEWMPDGQQILTDVESIAGAENVCLLSAPSEHPGSAAGKMRWIQKHLPSYKKRYLLGPSKGFVAAPGKILVDDGDHNIIDWRKKGGYAVLVPRPWNSLYHLTTISPAYLVDSVYVVRKMARIDAKRF